MPMFRRRSASHRGNVAGMSYDLAFWQGPRPHSDSQTLKIFEASWDELEKQDEDVPPTPAIRALVEELEARWPGHHPDAPWASYPLAGDASGGTLYVNLVFGSPDEDLELMAEIARGLGIVCFDPQAEALF